MSEWRIVCGEVEHVLREYPATHFDACVCDPPYGLKFMGRKWDYRVPSVALWTEVLRVLKPGAPLLAFGGTRTVHRVTVNIEDAGFDIEDTITWLHGQGKPATPNRLKPAHEPVVLARRPYPGTLALNLSRWGVGALAIDTARIKTDWSDRPESWKRSGHSKSKEKGMFGVAGNGITCHPGGRWPANVILDEEAGAMLDAQSGTWKTNRPSSRTGIGYGGTSKEVKVAIAGYDDTGGASRFFYCAKASRTERDGNKHPCVKPLALVEYLARLVLPTKPGTILVPFAGSGSEVIGALRAGWPSVLGIEREAQYIEIAEGRLRNAAA